MKNKTEIDDLDYLAAAGFSAVTVDADTKQQLLKRIQKRMLRAQWWWWLTPLVVITVAICSWSASNEKRNQQTIKYTATKRVPASQKEITLAPLQIVGEKYIRTIATPVPPNSPAFDTQEVIMLEQQKAKPVEHEELKMCSSEGNFIFIRDLKITEYGLLYFYYNREVELSGLPASSSGKSIVLKENEVKLYDLLDDALKYFKEGDYAAAMVQFRQLHAINNNDLNSQFYLGMCAYHRGWYAEAINYFTYCKEALNTSFKEEADFYLAICTLKSGDRIKGKQLLEAISSSTNFYKLRAREYLELNR